MTRKYLERSYDPAILDRSLDCSSGFATLPAKIQNTIDKWMPKGAATTLREAVQLTDSEWLGAPYFGPKSLSRLKEWLSTLGLTTGMLLPEVPNIETAPTLSGSSQMPALELPMQEKPLWPFQTPTLHLLGEESTAPNNERVSSACQLIIYGDDSLQMPKECARLLLNKLLSTLEKTRGREGTVRITDPILEALHKLTGILLLG